MTQYTTFAAGAIAHLNSLAAFGNVQLPFINVKSFQNAAGAWTGAIGEGGSEDDAIIQLAVAAATSANYPGLIVFPQGLYTIETLISLTNCHVLAMPGAKFTTTTADLDMIKLGRKSSWVGGMFDLEQLEYIGKLFTVSGDSWTTGWWGDIDYFPPWISDVAAYVKNLGYGVPPSAGGVGVYLEANENDAEEYKRVSNVRLNNLTLVYFDKGLHFHAQGTGGFVNANQATNLTIIGCNDCIYLQDEGYGIGGNLFSNIMTQLKGACTQNGIVMSGVAALNQVSNYQAWDWVNGWQIDLGSSASYNTIISNTGLTKVRDLGTDNLISGYSRKSWSGENLVLTEQVTYDAGTITNGEVKISDEFDLPGAVVGDFILLGSGDVKGCLVQAVITAANKAKIFVVNRTGSSQTIAATSWVLHVVKRVRGSNFGLWDVASVADGATAVKDYTFTGVVVGDFVMVAPPTSLDMSKIYYSAQVTATDTISVVMSNFSGDTFTHGNLAWSYKVIPQIHCNYTTTWDVGSLADGAGETKTATLVGLPALDILITSLAVDVVDMHVQAYAATVGGSLFARIQNETGGGTPIDLASTTWKVLRIDPRLGLPAL